MLGPLLRTLLPEKPNVRRKTSRRVTESSMYCNQGYKPRLKSLSKIRDIFPISYPFGRLLQPNQLLLSSDSKSRSIFSTFRFHIRKQNDSTYKLYTFRIDKISQVNTNATNKLTKFQYNIQQSPAVERINKIP